MNRSNLRLLWTFCLLILILRGGYSAELKKVVLSGGEFPNVVDYKKASKLVTQGNRLFAKGLVFKTLARGYYLQAVEYMPNLTNASLAFRLGECYHAANKWDSAYYYFSIAESLNSEISSTFSHLFADACYYTARYDKALLHYGKAKKGLKKKSEEYQEIEKTIKSCKHARDDREFGPSARIYRLKGGVNTGYNEYRPLFTEDSSRLFFSSFRPSMVSTKKIDKFHAKGKVEKAAKKVKRKKKKYFEQLFYAPSTGKELWGKGEPYPISSKWKYELSAVGIDKEENALIVMSHRHLDADFFISKMGQKKGKRPKFFSVIKLLSFHNETSWSFSPDKKTVYFAGERPGDGVGQGDIYYSDWDDKRKRWKKPKSLGSVVNSPLDEHSVFIHSDGKTLYFTSNGHNSLGGYDVFKTIRKGEDVWSKPENLGYPINTPNDEIDFCLSENKKTGYVSSNRPGSIYGSFDIFRVTMLERLPLTVGKNKWLADIPKEKKKMPKPSGMTLSGTVYDKETKQPLVAEIEAFNLTKNESHMKGKTTENGGFKVEGLSPENNYAINIRKDGYLFYSENIESKTETWAEKREVYLEKIRQNSKLVLRNVFFETGSAVLRSDSRTELLNAATLLKQNPMVRVEVSGHTDNVGTLRGNLTLSSKRAQAVLNFLIQNGVDRSRLQSIGRASLEPQESNRTAWGRKQNRRVELKILKR